MAEFILVTSILINNIINGSISNCFYFMFCLDTVNVNYPGPDLLPLWIVLGILAALTILYWCCWRPGWFPWRVCRLRNVRCGKNNVLCCRTCRRKCCACCLKLACCHGNGCCGPDGCFKSCYKCSTRTQTGFPEKEPSPQGTPTSVGHCACFPCCRNKSGR